MHLEYTPEEVRTLLEEHETLEYASATDADIAEAADILEGIEELVAKLDPGARCETVLTASLPAGEEFWIPVARNCDRAAGVAVSPDGSLSFMVTGHAFGDDFPTYFSARQAVAHALLGESRKSDPDRNAEVESSPGPVLEISTSVMDEDPIAAALKANGWAVAAGHTVADVDPEVLAAVYPLSEAGVAHLFAESGGIVLAMAGSTARDRRTAASSLPLVPTVGMEKPAGRRRKRRPAPWAVRAESRPAPRPEVPASWPLMSPADLASLRAQLGEIRQADPGTPQARLAVAVALLKARILKALEAAGGAEAEKRLLGPLTGRGAWSCPAAARLALCALARDGEVERLLHTSGVLLVARPGAPDETLARPLRRAFGVLAASALDERHFSEEAGWGLTGDTGKAVPDRELDDTAERFRAARFVRPSRERPLDVAAIRRRVRGKALVKAAVREAFRTDPTDAFEFLRAVLWFALIVGVYHHEMVRRAMAAQRSWDSEAERARLEKAGARLRREIIAGRKTRGGKPVAVTPAAKLDAERREERGAPAEDTKLRASIERRRNSGRAAYDTARALYLQRCPDLEHKLLHILRRDGAAPEREFVSRRRDLASGATSPETAVRAALGALAEAGKVRRVRSRKTGKVFLAAAEPLDETGYRRSLNSLIRDERFGIVNPWTEAGAAEAEGEADEWQPGTEDLEGDELDRLAPRRLRDTTSYEQPLPPADLVAEPAAQEEIDSVA